MDLHEEKLDSELLLRPEEIWHIWRKIFDEIDLFFSNICPPSSYNNSACFANSQRQVACKGDSGGPIFFEHQNKVYLYAVICVANNDDCQADDVGHWRYPTVGALIQDEDITWISNQGGDLVKNCIKP